MPTNAPSRPRFGRTRLAGAAAGAVALGVAFIAVPEPTRAASVSWDFQGSGFDSTNLGQSATLVGSDGVSTLTANAFVFSFSTHDWVAADVRQSRWGLGVDAGPADMDRTDTVNLLEVLRLEVPTAAVESAALQFTTFYDDPYFAVWTNDSGTLPDIQDAASMSFLANGQLGSIDNTVDLSDSASTYLFVTGDYRIDDYYGLTTEGFKVAGFTMETKESAPINATTPVPAALWLFGTAIAVLTGLAGTAPRTGRTRGGNQGAEA